MCVRARARVRVCAINFHSREGTADEEPEFLSLEDTKQLSSQDTLIWLCQPLQPQTLTTLCLLYEYTALWQHQQVSHKVAYRTKHAVLGVIRTHIHANILHTEYNYCRHRHHRHRHRCHRHRYITTTKTTTTTTTTTTIIIIIKITLGYVCPLNDCEKAFLAIICALSEMILCGCQDVVISNRIELVTSICTLLWLIGGQSTN